MKVLKSHVFSFRCLKQLASCHDSEADFNLRHKLDQCLQDGSATLPVISRDHTLDNLLITKSLGNQVLLIIDRVETSEKNCDGRVCAEEEEEEEEEGKYCCGWPGCGEDTTVRHSQHHIVSLSLKWFNCRH
jgi:hypothetical protein